MTNTADIGPHMFQGFDLHGRAAVVIGGTSGIGRAGARGLAAAVADVVAAQPGPCDSRVN